MSDRKALLIGAENYGEGFAPLPGVQKDIQLMHSALDACGYEVKICPQAVLNNASQLDELMREFCSAGGPDDVYILYFTGHGLLVDNHDCIVPEGTQRKAATHSSNQRVSTDLSRTVSESSTGLVLFIIDACRDKEDIPVTKGGSEWGDPTRLERCREHRFVRFFGCAADQVCQFLSTSADDQSCSLFTKAIAERISEGTFVSLVDLLPEVVSRCNDLLSQNAFLKRQEPRLSYGELSGEMQDILKRPIFGTVYQAALSSVWPSFDPNKLHCLVVISEYEYKAQPNWGLKELVHTALGGMTGQRIWEAFVAGCNMRRLVSNSQRVFSKVFRASEVLIGSFSVIDAFASIDALEKVTRAVVEADLVVFDITGFEPGVMLLIGIRSACCRSLSICSHGAGWQEGQPLEIPFNLKDLNINSHTPRKTWVGSNPVVERFVHRVETGFKQLSKHPHYLDLPAYDALRELGSDSDASSTINVSDRILVLCPYAPEFFTKWEYIEEHLKNALWQNKNISPVIERIIDFGTSQLIWQNLYEQIRRTAACVVDWSEYNPSVFLELGVRLAVSEWGVLQIVDEDYLIGGRSELKLEQINRMHRLLNPISYQFRAKSSAAFEKVAETLLQRNPYLDGEADSNRIHRVLLPVIGTIQEASRPVEVELKKRADALHHPEQGRTAAPQILFHGSRNMKHDSEKTALEFRIASWLYMEHRVRASKMKEDVRMWHLYCDLSRLVIDSLYDLGDDESIEFAEFIENRLKQRSEGNGEYTQ